MTAREARCAHSWPAPSDIPGALEPALSCLSRQPQHGSADPSTNRSAPLLYNHPGQMRLQRAWSGYGGATHPRATPAGQGRQHWNTRPSATQHCPLEPTPALAFCLVPPGGTSPWLRPQTEQAAMNGITSPTPCTFPACALLLQPLPLPARAPQAHGQPPFFLTRGLFRSGFWL